MDDYIGVIELATLAGVERTTVWRALEAGEIPEAHKKRDGWHVPRAAGLAWVEARRAADAARADKRRRAADAARTRRANREARALIAAVAGQDIAAAVVPKKSRP